MRILSTIFVTYVLLLTAAPSLFVALSSLKKDQCKTSCCSSEESQPSYAEASEGKEESCPVSEQNQGCVGCNPFMSCSNCYALISGIQVSASLIYSNQKFSAITENPNSAFLSDAWNPPKIV